MDFLDPKKTRRNSIQLLIGYVLVGFTILLTTTLLIYYTYGFGVNREGDLVQKGLVFISSQPSGADIYLNDELVDTTNAKLNLNAGKYSIDLRRDGYGSWSRDIEVFGSTVDHYVYPLLFPVDLRTEAVLSLDEKPSLTTQSPDRRWLVMLTDTQTGTFQVVDLNKDQDTVAETTTFSVPEELMTQSAGAVRWQVMEWSTNNRHMLLKRFYTAGEQQRFEYILADRQRPAGSHNLTRSLSLTPTVEVTLRDKKPDRYYLYEAVEKELSSASLNATEPTLEISGVLAYKAHGDDAVVYATEESAEDGKVAIKLRQNDRDYLLRQVKTSPKYLLELARYDGDWYAVLGSQAEGKVFIYQNPVESARAVKRSYPSFALVVSKPTDVSFSANAQFILAQNGKEFHVFDAENTRGYSYEAPVPLDPPQVKATWMDGHRLTYVSDGQQVVFDYDNVNRRILTDASPTYASAFDREYRYLYTFTNRTDGKPGLVLSATALRTPGDL